MVAQKLDCDHGHASHALVPMSAIELDIKAFLRVRAILLQCNDKLVLIPVHIALQGVDKER